MTVSTHCLRGVVRAERTRLDDGVDIGLYGGDSTHVGAVTLATPAAAPKTLQRPGHRDAVLSERWAAYFADRLGCPVCVRCGIHFDALSPNDLPAVFEACDRLKQALERKISC